MGNADKYIQKNYSQRHFTTLFLDGNHENHDALDSYPIEEWHGGKIHKITNSLFHLMRGQVFELGGKTFFTLGGAESSDKLYRKEGISWWARELPSLDEYNEAFKNLAKHGYKIDYILTHCAPEETVCDIGMPQMSIRHINVLTMQLDTIAQTVSFKVWYFGHYHDDSYMSKFHLLYSRVVELEE